MNNKFIIKRAFKKDIDAIKRIADSDKKAIGFIVRSIFEEAVKQKELFVVRTKKLVVGFIRFHKRKDGWYTMYEICIHKDYRGYGIGRALLEKIPKPKRCKCPVDNQSNNFHKKMKGTLIRTEEGRKRMLNVWEWK